MTELLTEQLQRAKHAQTALWAVSTAEINRILTAVAETIRSEQTAILAANQQDLASMGKDDPRYDRVLLTADRIENIAAGLVGVATLDDPVGRTLQLATRPNGLVLEKQSVPFGTVAVIYEARPNVTVDVFALCFKTRNAVVLKGGKEAQHTSEAFVALIQRVLEEADLPAAVCTLLEADRAVTTELLGARAFVDLLIPRGSQRLIEWVREHARVPMIETGAGVCHTYVDEAADLAMANRIVTNAKTRRVSVCNALDTLLLHASLIPKIDLVTAGLLEHRVEIHADPRAFSAIAYDPQLIKPATEADYGTEFLANTLAIKVVNSLDEAIEHIARNGSQHSEAIITENVQTAERFLREVDAAAVYHNASTAFTDGGEFGMGAEIGISTQKLHARGPMGLPELTTYKWIVRGSGQIRPK